MSEWIGTSPMQPELKGLLEKIAAELMRCGDQLEKLAAATERLSPRQRDDRTDRG